MGLPRVDRGGRQPPDAALSRRGLLASFAWGRPGLGSRELARSIIEHATGSPALAERHCRAMTHAVVAQLPALGFELTRDDVIAWLEGGPTPESR